jgi:hypothetical protein
VESISGSDVRAGTLSLARELVAEVFVYCGETPKPLIGTFDFGVPFACIRMPRLAVGLLILFSKWTVSSL